MQTYLQRKDQILKASNVSYWLKDTIDLLDRCDPVDALHDAELLCELLQQRYDEIVCGLVP
jgi:hypothetical protein